MRQDNPQVNKLKFVDTNITENSDAVNSFDGVSSTPVSNRATFPQNNREYSLDTIRLRFLLPGFLLDKYILRKVATEIIHDKDNDIEDYFVSFTALNFLNQNVKCYPEKDDFIVFLEFSLPKFLYGSNLYRASWDDLKNYMDAYVFPYTNKNTLYINRIDLALNFSFSSLSDLNSFNQFLNTVRIGNSSIASSKDFDFWKLNNRCVRFYNKSKAIKDLDKPEIGKFDNFEDYLKSLSDYNNYVDFAYKNNIGRLEFEYKKDWFSRKFHISNFNPYSSHINFETLKSFDWWSEFKKDFAFLEDNKFSVQDTEKVKEIVSKLKSSKLFKDYLEFFFYAQSVSLDFAESEFKIRKGKHYSRFLNRFYEITGYTINQALQKSEVCITFPENTIYLDSLTYQLNCAGENLKDCNVSFLRKRFLRLKRMKYKVRRC